MKPGHRIVALLLWAGLSAHAFSSSVVGPGGIAAAPVQTVAAPAKPGSPAPVKPGSPAPANASPAVANSVKFTVRDTDKAPVPGAKVKVSNGMNGNATSTRTNERGIATFSALPAVQQDVNVTAEGYVSHAGSVDLRTGRTEFQIELEPREERGSNPSD